MGDRVIVRPRGIGSEQAGELGVLRTDLRLHTTCPDCISILDSPPDRSDPARVEA